MKVIKAVVKGFKLYFSSHVVYKVLAVLPLRLFDRSLRLYSTKMAWPNHWQQGPTVTGISY